MLLSIIIPAHNEAATIGDVLSRVESADILGMKREIIAVDDGSVDDTGKILKDWAAGGGDDYIKRSAIFHSRNLGKGAALRSGFGVLKGDFVIIQDADLEYDPADFRVLLEALLEKRSSAPAAVFGTRGIKRYPQRGFHYVVGAKILTWTFNLLFGTKLSDLYTGYKLVRAEFIKSLVLKSDGFEIEAELAALLVKKGAQIAEVPISYRPRNKSQGKHIGLADAFRGFWMIIKERFNLNI